MFTQWLRKVTSGLVRPIARFLGRTGISPNALTIIGCLFNIVVALVAASGQFLLAGILLVPAFLLDAFDGAVAREMNRVTTFGAFLDSCLDRISESAVLVGIAWWSVVTGAQLQVLLAIFSIIGAMLVSYTRARAEGIAIECKVGYFSRVERGLLVILGLLSGLISPLLWVMAIGTWITAAHRIIYVYLRTKKLADS